MLRLYILAPLLAFLFFSLSCKKQDNQWKQPAAVRFNMDVNRGESLGNNLSFNGGNISLEYFTFDGQRDQGGDVYFHKDYSATNGLNVPYDQEAMAPELNFDIPQGSYSQIKISFKTFGKPGDKQITVTGSFTNTVSKMVYPVVLEYTSNEAYEVFAKSKGGKTQIILDKDMGSFVKIKMDPVYWFQNVTAATMNSAGLTNVNGVPTIIINNATNSSIYQDIKSRVHDGVTDIVFN